MPAIMSQNGREMSNTNVIRKNYLGYFFLMFKISQQFNIMFCAFLFTVFNALTVIAEQYMF